MGPWSTYSFSAVPWCHGKERHENQETVLLLSEKIGNLGLGC